MKKICVLGGDLRQYYLAEEFASRGYAVASLGVPHRENTHKALPDALRGADVLALPCPLRSGEKIQIFTDKSVDAESITRFVGRNCAIFVGGDFSFPSFNYLKDEAFLQKNAEITAEVAVMLMMQQIHRTVDGANALIVGFGRIGKALARRLFALGCSVSVSARKEKDISQAIACGYRPVITRQYPALDGFDSIFSTVPACVFTSEQVAAIRCPFLELASAPGGLPQDGEKPAQYLLARGLPGKYAPQSAAQAMAAFILQKTAL